MSVSLGLVHSQDRQPALVLLQAQDISSAVRRLPKSLAQWLPVQHASTGLLPASRLTHVLQRHYQPAQLAHIKAAGQQPHGHADSTSRNPRIAPYAALGDTQEQPVSQEVKRQQGGRQAAQAAGALLRRRAEKQKAVLAAGRMSRFPSFERRPQSAGSSAVALGKGKPGPRGKTKPRARSVSPNSQYHFSCTSSVPEHGSSCFQDAADVVSQGRSVKFQGGISLGRSRAAAGCPPQLPSWQGDKCSGPVHSTYVLPLGQDLPQPAVRQTPDWREASHSPKGGQQPVMGNDKEQQLWWQQHKMMAGACGLEMQHVNAGNAITSASL